MKSKGLGRAGLEAMACVLDWGAGGIGEPEGREAAGDAQFQPRC